MLKQIENEIFLPNDNEMRLYLILFFNNLKKHFIQF